MMDLFLEQYSLEELAQMELEELAAYLRSKGKNRFSDPEQVAKSIQNAVRSSYRLDKVMEDSIDTTWLFPSQSFRRSKGRLK